MGPSFWTLACTTGHDHVNRSPSAQGLDRLHQGADRFDAKDCSLAGVFPRAVCIRPPSRQPHRQSVRRTHHQLARAAVQHLEALPLQWVVPSRDLHFRRRGRDAVIVPIV